MLFCATALICVADSDSYADKTNYELYVEVLNDNHIVSDVYYVYFESEADNEKYIEAANAAINNAGIAGLELVMGKYGGISIKYNDSSNNSSWYSNGMIWTKVSKTSEDYINNTKAGVAVNNAWIDQEAYDALPESEKVHWQADEYMADSYQKKLEAPGTLGTVTNYFIFLNIVQDDLVSCEATTIEFKAENNYSAWVYGFNTATKSIIDSDFNNVKASYSHGMIEVDYGDNANTAAWVQKGSKWVFVENTIDYLSGDWVDFELKNGWITAEQYDGLAKSEKKFWEADGSTDFYKRVAIGEEVEEVIGLLVYVGIGLLIVFVIVIIVVVVVVKKKKSA